MDSLIDDIEVTSVDDDDSGSYSENSSVPFENVDNDYESDIDSPRDQFPVSDQFPTDLKFDDCNTGMLSSRMPAKENGGQHESFRNRPKKKEMRRGSFTYKQVSDDATPTAHRKQLFSKRSACK